MHFYFQPLKRGTKTSSTAQPLTPQNSTKRPRKVYLYICSIFFRSLVVFMTALLADPPLPRCPPILAFQSRSIENNKEVACNCNHARWVLEAPLPPSKSYREMQHTHSGKQKPYLEKNNFNKQAKRARAPEVGGGGGEKRIVVLMVEGVEGGWK